MEKGCYGYSNNGYQDMLDCVHQSWPWARLTEDEKEHLDYILESARGEVKLAEPRSKEYTREWNRCSVLNSSCLFLLGYRNGRFRENQNGQADLRTKEERIADVIENIKKDLEEQLLNNF